MSVNPYRSLFYKSIVAIAICMILVGLSYFFVDKPVTYYIYNHHINHFIWLKWFTYLPAAFLVLAPICVAIILVTLIWQPLTKLGLTLLTAAVNLTFMIQVKDGFKYIFGRTWPLTWTQNNPSLIKNNVYGFFPFHGGLSYASFPSGDATVTFATIIVFWLVYPKLRWLYVILLTLNLVGLLGMDYHFVSDIIAGSVLGSISAVYAVQLTNPLQAAPSFRGHAAQHVS